MKISGSSKTKIAYFIKDGLSLKEIQKRMPKLTILQTDIEHIKKHSHILKDIIKNGIIYRKCIICGNEKPYTKEFFKSGGKGRLESRCKYCFNLIRKNKRIIGLSKEAKIKERKDSINYRKKNKEIINKKRRERYLNLPKEKKKKYSEYSKKYKQKQRLLELFEKINKTRGKE